MIRNAQPLTWRPKGISDTLDGTSTFEGAMSLLANLIPDPSTQGLWQCRPAAIPTIIFSGGGSFSSGFSSGFQTTSSGINGQVSVFMIVGDFVYGLHSSTADNKDHPFAFNLLTGNFITVAFAAGASLPQSPPIAGPWTPPQMDQVGIKLLVAHPGFAATADFIGWFDITTPTAPVWHTGNMTGAITFSIPPTYVAQFNNRAFWATGQVASAAVVLPGVVWSDVLNPTQVTVATQVLTFNDIVPITALGQLRFYNQLGGIVQALVIFKGAENMYQVTGDPALNNLAMNAMNVATGTLAPNSLCATPKGLAFIAPDGLRIIDYQANISDPIGIDGQGINVPFLFATVPSRICCACNGDIIRITVQNGNAGNVQQEYWLHMSRKIWTGPHSFAANRIEPYKGTFLAAPVPQVIAGILTVDPNIYRSDVLQSTTSTFTEQGAPLSWTYQTCFLPDLDRMSNYTIMQSTLDLQLAQNTPPVAVSATDQNRAVIDSLLLVQSGTATIWGAFTWDNAVWGAPNLALAARRLLWSKPITFTRCQFTVTGQASSPIKLGSLRMKYKVLKYLTDIDAAA